MPGYLLTALAVALSVLSGGPSFALEPTLVESGERIWSSVQGDAQGNRSVSFNGNLTGNSVIREKFVDVPAWIVSRDFDGDGVNEAVVQFNEGTLRILSQKDGRVRTMAASRNLAPGSAPVVLASIGGEPTGGLVGMDDKGNLVSIDFSTGRQRRLAGGFSTLSHPLAADLDKDGEKEVAAVSKEGFLIVVKGRAQTRSDKAVELLPDTRITMADMDGDGNIEILALSKPAMDALSGRPGDGYNAHGVAVFTWNGRSLRLKGDFELPDGQVFQTLTPFVAGTKEDADPLLLLTVAEEKKGTQIRSYLCSGGRVREIRKGPMIGEATWINILGSSPMGSGDKVFLLAATIFEDDKGDLELYRMDLAQTRITLGSVISTHPPGSRLVEDSLIGDMNGDGEMELLAPGTGRSNLMIFSLDRNRLKAKEIFNSSGKISTNLCPGDFNGDGLSDVIFGLDDGTLVILLGE